MDLPRYLQGATAAFVEAADLRLDTTDGRSLPAHRQQLARCCGAFAAGLSFRRTAGEEEPADAEPRASARGKRKQPDDDEGGVPAAAAAADTIRINVPAEAAELFLDLAYNPSTLKGEDLLVCKCLGC